MKLWLNTFILWVKCKHLKRNEKKMGVKVKTLEVESELRMETDHNGLDLQRATACGGWDLPVSSAVQGVLGGGVGWRRERRTSGVSLTKSHVVSSVHKWGIEMVSEREEKSRRKDDTWILHKEEEKKKKKNKKRRGR